MTTHRCQYCGTVRAVLPDSTIVPHIFGDGICPGSHKQGLADSAPDRPRRVRVGATESPDEQITARHRRRIAVLLRDGLIPQRIAAVLGLTVRAVRRYQQQLRKVSR